MDFPVYGCVIDPPGQKALYVSCSLFVFYEDDDWTLNYCLFLSRFSFEGYLFSFCDLLVPVQAL
jgi:hypothetical protein